MRMCVRTKGVARLCFQGTSNKKFFLMKNSESNTLKDLITMDVKFGKDATVHYVVVVFPKMLTYIRPVLLMVYPKRLPTETLLSPK